MNIFRKKKDTNIPDEKLMNTLAYINGEDVDTASMLWSESEQTESEQIEPEEQIGLKNVFREIGKGFKLGHKIFKNTIKNRVNKITGFFKAKKAKKLAEKEYNERLENAFYNCKTGEGWSETASKVQIFEKVFIIQNGINLMDPKVQLRMEDIREEFSDTVSTKLHDELGYDGLYTEEDYETTELANGQKINKLVLKGGFRK